MLDALPKVCVEFYFRVAKLAHEAARNPEAKKAIDAGLRAIIRGSVPPQLK
jgi:hypothetical protein